MKQFLAVCSTVMCITGMIYGIKESNMLCTMTSLNAIGWMLLYFDRAS